MNDLKDITPDQLMPELHSAILATIDSNDCPLTSPQLYRRTRAQFPRIDLRTVHYAVDELVRYGTLRPVIRSGKLRKYRRVEECSDNNTLQQSNHHDHDPCSTDQPQVIPSSEAPVPVIPSPNGPLRHLDAMRDALRAIHYKELPGPYSVVFPPGLDRSVLKHLPFRVRTLNCLINAGFFEGSNAITVADLLRIRNFGHTSLRDVLLVVESFLTEHDSDTDPQKSGSYAPDGHPPTRLSHPDINELETDNSTVIGKLISPLLTAALEFQGMTTLADILSPDVVQLASVMGHLAKMKELKIESMVHSDARYSSIVFKRSSQILDTVKPTERTILDSRILSSQPKTLSEVGSIMRVSKERVRQIQAKLEKRIDSSLGKELHTMSDVLKAQLGPIVRERDVDLRIGILFVDSVSPPGAIAHYALKARLGYERIVNGICLDASAVSVIAEVKSALGRFADDAGIVDPARVRYALAGDEWGSCWSLLLECCGLPEVFGLLALRDTAKARVKAAVIAAGKPVTRDELCARCGLSVAQVGAVLASLPSLVRADKSRWGLAEWIDDEYEGIPAEIVQRIHEDGGATTTGRLLEELPRKFGVSAASVLAYLKTPKFTVAEGYVSLADPSSVQLGHFDDVIDGRDDRGEPYWTFVVQESHISGYSLAGVPPELAKFVGCVPDSSLHLRVADPAGCRALSVRWRLSSIAGVTIGYLADPLRYVGAKPGDRVRITITGSRTAEVALDSASRPRAASSAHSVIERMKRRRKVV